MRRKNLEAKDRRIHRALGRAIHRRREAIGLSKADVAVRAKLDKSQYGRVEKGGGCSTPCYVDIARALGWTPAELFSCLARAKDDTVTQ